MIPISFRSGSMRSGLVIKSSIPSGAFPRGSRAYGAKPNNAGSASGGSSVPQGTSSSGLFAQESTTYACNLDTMSLYSSAGPAIVILIFLILAFATYDGDRPAIHQLTMGTALEPRKVSNRTVDHGKFVG